MWIKKPKQKTAKSAWLIVVTYYACFRYSIIWFNSVEIYLKKNKTINQKLRKEKNVIDRSLYIYRYILRYSSVSYVSQIHIVMNWFQKKKTKIKNSKFLYNTLQFYSQLFNIKTCSHWQQHNKKIRLSLEELTWKTMFSHVYCCQR